MFNREALKTIRKTRDLSQKQLAMAADLSFSMVSKLESGEQKKPSLDTLNKLADALNVSVCELLTTAQCDINTSLGARIKDLRVRGGYTQKDLASLLGVSASTVTKYEIGQLEPSIAMLKNLSTVFDIKVSELVDLSPICHEIDIKALNTQELLILLQTVSAELLHRNVSD